MDKLETIITRMLKENTGASFLDSGGAYGRNYERNQTRDFEKEPACQVECNEFNGEVELIISYNIYHYLCNFLDYDEDCEKLNQKFIHFCNLPDKQDESYFHCRNQWLEDREKMGEDRFTEINTANTYNYDNLLSQVIEYTHFVHKDENYILLQIHGGCDVRGGYTKPVIFKVPDMDYFIMAQNDCYAFARYPIDKTQPVMEGIDKPKESYCWDSDDGGYHWYAQDGEPELKSVLRCKGDKPFVEVGGKLLPLEISVMESY